MRLPGFGRSIATLLFVAALPLSMVSCGKTKPASGTGGSGSTGGSGTGGGPGGASGSGGAGGGGLLAPCLDRPTDLPRPPINGLPCELIPPSLGQ